MARLKRDFLRKGTQIYIKADFLTTLFVLCKNVNKVYIRLPFVKEIIILKSGY